MVVSDDDGGWATLSLFGYWRRAAGIDGEELLVAHTAGGAPGGSPFAHHLVLQCPATFSRLALRFTGVRHSTESFVGSVYAGVVGPDDVAVDDDRVIGTIAMYGHGSSYGSQGELDASLEPFDVDVPLDDRAVFAECETRGEIVLSVIVRDLDDNPQPAEWLRFDGVTVTAFP